MSEQSKLIFKKMSDVMRDIKAVTKDQKNVAQGFKFRGIDQFVNALYPALTKHGVFMTPFCIKEEHELKEVVRSSGKSAVDKHVTLLMGYNFYAEDGSHVTVGPIPAEGLDSGDKATNKALSAALKYALIQTFSVPTEDMAEADLDTPEISPTKLADAPLVNTKTVAKAELKVTTGLSKPESASASAVTTLTSNNAGTASVSLAPAKISTFRKNKPAVPVEAPTEAGNGWE